MTYKIKTANKNDINLMLDWAKDEGWNPGINDHIPFQVADPNGFFIGYLENRPVASISTVKYQNKFGFLGFYIVKSEFRGKGLGLKIWHHGIEYLKDIGTIGLDGVVEQQPNYKKSGFSLAHRNRRYSGTVPNRKHLAPLVNVKDIAIKDITKYEQQLFPCDRSEFLKSWIDYAAHALAYIKDDNILGYGVIRRCFKGYKIGPLFADNYDIAEQLFLGLCGHIPGAQVILDTPEPNQDASRLAEQYYLTMTFETARMYTNTHPDLDLKKIYGITSFELG